MSLFSFWAKTGELNQINGPVESHPLICHLLDVAASAEALLRQERSRLTRLAKSCNVDADDLSRCFVALVALHDIGKCARGFQGKVLDLWPSLLGPRPDTKLSVRHDVAGVWLFTETPGLAQVIERLLPGLSPSKRRMIVQAVCSHHGEPIDGDFPDIANPRKLIGADAQEAAVEIAEAMLALLQPPPCPLADEHGPLISFWLSGLAVLADWLGSNRAWFDFQPAPDAQDTHFLASLQSYWTKHARPRAVRALDEAGLTYAQVSPRIGLAHLFGTTYEPTPLQEYAETVNLPDGPVLFIIEDMTGAGKTEAAVILAHRLMLAGKARGLHIGLPTMATANAMFERMAKSYRRLFDDDSSPSIVLTHGRRELFVGFALVLPGLLSAESDIAGFADPSEEDSDDPSKIEATAFCADWLARSNKQAFLAQIGAGTIDQGILSVLPARHQSLRLWGLSDKVLVIDEAHAYDAYMSREIECLLEFQAALGGSAIVLSATLPQAKRADWVNAFLKGAQNGDKSSWKPSRSAYPLVTSVAPGKIEETPVALRDGLAREVIVQRIASLDEAHSHALEAAQQGAAVALIRNTVDEAIASYDALAHRFERVMLFHARFAMGDRHKIEIEVLNRFGKNGTGERNAILIATQVVEQSLDIDFDLIVSDLAPIDLLIQRAGRLWRHAGRERPIEGPRFLVLSPEPSEDVGSLWPSPVLPKTNFVYRDAALLWRSAKAIFTARKIVSRTSLTSGLCETGEVRTLIEAAYSTTERIAIPPGLERAENEAAGVHSGERTHARYNTLEFAKGYDWDGTKWERDTRVKTRLGEETVILRLARIEADMVVPWVAIEDGDIRRAWSLSEVGLRKSQCSGSRNSAQVQKVIDKAKRGWTLSEREMPVVVLHPVDNVVWLGAAEVNANPISITYSASAGLRFSGAV